MVVRDLLSITFLVGIGVLNAGPLSPDENRLRHETCGGFNLPMSEKVIEGTPDYTNTSEETWLLTIHQKGNGNPIPKTTAFLISPRHIMTSAQVVIGGDRTWKFLGFGKRPKIDFGCTVNGSIHGNYSLPTEALETLDIWDPVKSLDVKVVKGRLFYSCLNNTRVDHVPLLLEISPTTTRQVPCFVDEQYTSNYKNGDEVHSYGVSIEKTMKHHKIQLESNNDSIWYVTNLYREGGQDRGGPLVRVNKGKSTVIGLKYNDPPTKEEPPMYFFNLGAIEKEICEFSGVCWKFPTLATTSKTTVTKSITLNPDEENAEEDDDDPNTSIGKLELLEIVIIFCFYWM